MAPTRGHFFNLGEAWFHPKLNETPTRKPERRFLFFCPTFFPYDATLTKKLRGFPTLGSLVSSAIRFLACQRSIGENANGLTDESRWVILDTDVESNAPLDSWRESQRWLGPASPPM